MVKGETYNLQLFESEAFRHFINVFTNKQNGITQGCEIQQNSESITIGQGYFFILGGLLRETTGTENEIPTDAGYYKLVYEIDLSKVNTKDTFNQGSYKFVKALGDYPNLTQQDLDNGGTIYQLPFCQFRITEQGLQDFQDIREFVNYGVYEKKGTVLYEDETGTTGTVTLSDNISNYKYIDVYGEYADNYCYARIPATVGAKSVLQVIQRTGNNNVYLRFSDCTLADASITRYNYSELLAGNVTFEQVNIINIYKVIGYKG